MVLAFFGLVDGELAGGVVAELLSDAFSVYKGEAVADDTAWIPVAQDAVSLGFPVRRRISPETFACHSAAHAVWVETARYKMDWPAIDFSRVQVPVFFVKQLVVRLDIANGRLVLADALLESVLLTQSATVQGAVRVTVLNVGSFCTEKIVGTVA